MAPVGKKVVAARKPSVAARKASVYAKKPAAQKLDKKSKKIAKKPALKKVAVAAAIKNKYNLRKSSKVDYSQFC